MQKQPGIGPEEIVQAHIVTQKNCPPWDSDQRTCKNNSGTHLYNGGIPQWLSTICTFKTRTIRDPDLKRRAVGRKQRLQTDVDADN